MRKVISLLVAAAFSLALVGCASEPAKKTEPVKPGTEKKADEVKPTAPAGEAAKPTEPAAPAAPVTK